MPQIDVILAAEVQAPIAVILPLSGREVLIRRFVRRDERHADPVPRAASCWAPNKPSIDFRGSRTLPEFVLVRLLEEAGWAARWAKNWAGGREFCSDVDRPKPLTPAAAQTFAAIHERAGALRGSGSWDVFAWRDGEYLFIESKQHRSSDRLNENQRAWLEAALDLGVSIDAFAVVEYDAGPPPVRAQTSSAIPARRPKLPEGLVEALDLARYADPSIRIQHRDAVTEFGALAIDPMVAWLADDRLRRFAITVLGSMARSERAALAHLNRYAAAGGTDSDLAESAARRAELSATHSLTVPGGAPSFDVYVATGHPPSAHGSCGIRNRDGSPCQNPGRHPVGNVWSCTTHFRAATRRGAVS